MQIIGLFSSFFLLFVIFLFVEKRASDPIISFSMFKKRLFATTNAIALLYGAAFIIATVYLPIFIQGVYGGSATNAGLLLTPMMLGSVAGSQLGGFLTTKTSFRNIMLLSAVFFIPGIFLLSTLTPDIPRSIVTLYMVIAGFGVGFSFSTLGILAIHGFDMRQRGSASSTNSFSRSLGMTLGITVFGILQRNSFENGMFSAFGGQGMTNAITDSRAILTPEARESIPAPVLDQMIDILASSIANTFMWALVPAVLALVCILLMGNDRALGKSPSAPKPERG